MDNTGLPFCIFKHYRACLSLQFRGYHRGFYTIKEALFIIQLQATLLISGVIAFTYVGWHKAYLTKYHHIDQNRKRKLLSLPVTMW
jgi:hypothetical protein